MAHLFISAAHKSSGKTTFTLGLCAALTAKGLTIQSFKKGPDYIDPLWLGQATYRPCHNLDFYTMTSEEIVSTVAKYTQDADITLIEGNKGLHDGLDLEGSNSSAALAHLLKAPVILVIDTQGITRGIAPLILGYQLFDKNIHIAGIILNKVAGKRHESKLRAAMEYYTQIPVLGALYRNPELEIVERHLGLMPSNEDQRAQEKIHTIAKWVEEQVDLDEIIKIAHRAPPLTWLSSSVTSAKTNQVSTMSPIKIGVVRDAAFGFYYPGDLIALENAGAKLVSINALQDEHLPELEGLFIGGGFPEEHIDTLTNNQSLRQDIYHAVERGMPVYAECGGLMYLARQLSWKEKTCPMVGALPLDTVMSDKPQGRGYVYLRETGQGLWPLQDSHGQLAEFPAHEFHYSKVVNLPTHLPFAYQVLRGFGLNGQHDGIVYKNTLASYAHLRDVDNNHWTQRFTTFIRACLSQP